MPDIKESNGGEPAAALPSHDDLLKAVGGALSNWSLVELQLATLFEAISDVPDQNRARALFASIINFEVRLGVCNRLMALEQIDEVTTKMWRKLAKKLSRNYGKRHELAHFSINYDDAGEPTLSPFLTSEKFAFDKVRHLGLNQIKERSRKFIELHKAVGWFAVEAFWRRVTAHEGERPTNEEPAIVAELRAAVVPAAIDE